MSVHDMSVLEMDFIARPRTIFSPELEGKESRARAGEIVLMAKIERGSGENEIGCVGVHGNSPAKFEYVDFRRCKRNAERDIMLALTIFIPGFFLTLIRDSMCPPNFYVTRFMH